MNDRFATIKAARKRCMSMGKTHVWQPCFDQHKIAAVISNYTAIFDGSDEPLDKLFYILHMAEAVNRYCDSNLVSGDLAAEYWLDRCLWVIEINFILDFGVFFGEKKLPQPPYRRTIDGHVIYGLSAKNETAS